MLGKLKDLLIVSEPAKPQAAAQAAKALPDPATPVAADSKVDEKIVEALNKALSAKALEGYDYLKFYDAQKDLEAVIPDEATRYRSTFMTVKSMVTKAKLLETAGHYLEVLDESKNDFLRSEADAQTKIAEQGKAAQDLETKIAAHLEQIKKLQDEIAGMRDTHRTLAEKVDADRRKADRMKASFIGVADSMQQSIRNDIEKINKYLG